MNRKRLERICTFLICCLVYHCFCLLQTSFAQQVSNPELNVPYAYVGKISSQHARENQAAPWSIGGETLDRDYANFQAYKQYLGPLGIPFIRLQGGWAKSEKEKGKYDFTWLDEIIDDALAQDVQPWVELSYGNPIYKGGGEAALAGGIPTSEEALKAWDKWAAQMVKRYKDRITYWEIWNEPDISKTITAEEYARFYIRTADIIKKYQPDAVLMAIGLAGISRDEYVDTFLNYLKAQNKLDLVDIITYHGYAPRPEDSYEYVSKLRDLAKSYDASIELWQGENGAPSTPADQTVGAMTNLDWTEISQAKWFLRRMLGDKGHGIAVTNVFTMSDLHYAKGDHMTGLNSKGLLRANPDGSIAYVKPSYYAVQNLVSVMDQPVQTIPAFSLESNADQEITAYAFQTEEGDKKMLTLWFSDERPDDALQPKATDVSMQGIGFHEPVYIDLLSGKIYEIPQSSLQSQEGVLQIKDLPILDVPIMITEKTMVVE
ncbi:hypothetical protein WJR50_26865 [Catalinimonas sp. 4WD22]|uniref:GH39 family glycosyl hydrolase n=1 Tax=Catalinimonas locisalis TaxID=3133978 RepID=UPI0031014FFF